MSNSLSRRVHCPINPRVSLSIRPRTVTASQLFAGKMQQGLSHGRNLELPTKSCGDHLGSWQVLHYVLAVMTGAFGALLGSPSTTSQVIPNTANVLMLISHQAALRCTITWPRADSYCWRRFRQHHRPGCRLP